MKRIWGSLILLIFAVCACQGPTPPELPIEDEVVWTDNLSDKKENSLEDEADTVSVKVKITEHSVKILLPKEDLKKSQLSAANVKELESWWDSLPKPIQSQIKANEVEIELVSNVRSTDKAAINSSVTDTRIENTGAALERIIGSSTDMTFTVNTTFLEGKTTVSTDELSTNISLVKKMPVKLAQFNSEIILKDNDISNKNIQSLQYWWTTLPAEVQQKIQSREVIIELTAVAIDRELDGKENSNVGSSADEYAFIMTDILSQMTGYQKIGKRNVAVANIESNSMIEKVQTGNAHIDAAYFIRLQLKNAKLPNVTPSL